VLLSNENRMVGGHLS